MSEFGKGLTYNLGLFLAHAERDSDKKTDSSLWFNGAADHLYELEIPDSLPVNLKDRLERFRDKCIDRRLLTDTPKVESDKTWAIQEAKDLLREIDSHFGISTEKGEWE